MKKSNNKLEHAKRQNDMDKERTYHKQPNQIVGASSQHGRCMKRRKA